MFFPYCTVELVLNTYDKYPSIYLRNHKPMKIYVGTRIVNFQQEVFLCFNFPVTALLNHRGTVVGMDYFVTLKLTVIT